MSETNRCIIITSVSSQKANACHNTQDLLSKGLYTNYTVRGEVGAADVKKREYIVLFTFTEGRVSYFIFLRPT